MNKIDRTEKWPTFWKETEENIDWEVESKKAFDFWHQTLNSCKYVVAPMVDQSELAWRVLSHRHGAQLCYTPMLHAHVFAKDARYRQKELATCAEDKPLIIQFCANNPETLLSAARLAEDHCVAVDLNLGCPQSIAKKGHYGAFLQDEWQLIYDMVNICHRNLKIPITCKIRRFEDVDKTIAYARMLQTAGCRLLTVHGRTREMKGIHTGIADWSYIKAVREAVQIPVFANGNIQYLSDVEQCMKETGVHGVMSAEGNLHNPALFTNNQFTVWDMCKQYIDLVKLYPCHISFIRGHLFKTLHHALQKHLEVRNKLAKAKTLDQFYELLADIEAACQADLQAYTQNPQGFDLGGLKLPYWICQPYTRPLPGAAAERTEDKHHRKCAINLMDEINGNKISTEEQCTLKRAKKLLRNPQKIFVTKESRFIKCPKCGNPKGMSCDHAMCKPCCKRFAIEEQKQCAGHKFYLNRKRKSEEEPENDEKCRKSENHTVPGVPDGKINDHLETVNNKDGKEIVTETSHVNTTTTNTGGTESP